MQIRQEQWRVCAPIAVAVAMLCANAPALAGSTTIGNVDVEYGATLNYGVSQRLRSPDPKLIDPAINPGAFVADDGNRSFDKHAIVSNRISALGEVDFRYKRSGFFMRGSAFHDFSYHGKNDNDSPFTSNHFGPHNEFAPETRDVMGTRARLLDAYLYTGFDLGQESSMTVKLGKHVVQWGEGLFFPNIAGAQGPVDANKANLPGIQVKDILLPVGQLSAVASLNDKWSVMAFTQYDFEPLELPASGSYFSYGDILGPGAGFMALPSFTTPGAFDRYTRLSNKHARNSGQWGVGTRYRVTFDTEIGLYHIRYHSKSPTLAFDFVNRTYRQTYKEDIKLTGASVATRLGPVSFAGELSYKQDVPVWTLANNQPTNNSDGNVWQAQINAIYTMNPNSLVKGSTAIVGELVTQKVSSYDDKGSRPLAYSDSASAFQVMVTPSWPNIFTGWDLSVPISYAHMLHGKPSGDSLGSLTGKGDKRFSIGADFTYLNNLQVGVSLNQFLGSPDLTHRPLTDRDYLAFNVKYNF